MATSTRLSRLVPASLERDLTLSYVAVFAVVLLVFALAVHIVVVSILERETTTRLNELAQVGQSVVDATKNGFYVDTSDQTVRSLNAAREGLQWFDTSGKLIAAVGLRASSSVIPARTQRDYRVAPGVDATMRLLTVTFALEGRPERLALVRAVVSNAPLDRTVYGVDTGILAGLVFAILASLFAGRLLTQRAIRGVEENMRLLKDFTTDAAHELRGPITAIVANADTGTPVDCTTVLMERTFIDSIRSAAAQMMRLTDDLLILARSNQPLEREIHVVDLAASIRRIADLHAEEARRRDIALDVDVVGNAYAYGNPDQIDRIVANLIENAISYTGQRGRVAISCSADRSGARVAVSDTGAGIARENLDRVFERFWRGDASRTAHGGSGLGLAIARALSRRHGGDITVTSKPGSGSEFVATFPTRPP